MFRGVITALATPFDEDLNIDFGSLENLIEFQKENGVDGILIFGTTGESPSITDEEFVKVLEFAKKYRDDLTILVGIGSNNTQKTVEKAKKILEMGYENALVVVPYYNKPNTTGMYIHFSKVAETGVKVMVYDVPGRTGTFIRPETLKKLRENHDNIVSLKYASADFDRLMKHLMNLDEDFTILSGDDNLTVPMISIGVQGVVSVASNVYPAVVKEMVSSALKGDFETARELHFKMYPVFKALFVETNPVPVKYALYKKGIIKSPVVRPPLGELSAESKEAVEKALF